MLILGLVLGTSMAVSVSADEPPVKALYVTGGGWHDYEGQVAIITNAMREAIPGIEITVAMVEGHGGEHARHPVFQVENWAEGYDVVVYNKCNAPRFSDPEWIKRIVAPHKEGLPAVLIHGTMHNFWPDENESGQWIAFCGVTSRNHERHAPVTVTVVEPDHVTMRGLPRTWTNPEGELYRIADMDEAATPLAVGVSSEEMEHCVVWTHQFGKARIFGTTLGHHNSTMKSEEFQTFFKQGLQWALGR